MVRGPSTLRCLIFRGKVIGPEFLKNACRKIGCMSSVVAIVLLTIPKLSTPWREPRRCRDVTTIREFAPRIDKPKQMRLGPGRARRYCFRSPPRGWEAINETQDVTEKPA